MVTKAREEALFGVSGRQGRDLIGGSPRGATTPRREKADRDLSAGFAFCPVA